MLYLIKISWSNRTTTSEIFFSFDKLKIRLKIGPDCEWMRNLCPATSNNRPLYWLWSELCPVSLQIGAAVLLLL